MLCRTTIASAALLLSVTLPASALNLNPTSFASLSSAAGRMKVKDFAGARQAALKSDASGARAFLIGMSCARLELWEEAAGQLAAAADSYPLLADYALYYQGLALGKLARPDQALPPLYRLLKQYPESRLARVATLLYADTLAAGGYHKQALESYGLFIERYPSGSDALSAQMGSASSREKLGDSAAAAQVFRGIWLNHPASPLAEKAAQELQRISAAGTLVPPYTTAELFKRGATLYDLGRYAQAARSYRELPLAGESPEFSSKVSLRIGQALLKAKRYQEAEAALRTLSQGPAGAGASEANLWLAKALDKNGKTEQACDLLLRLAQAPQGGAVAEDALLEAAYLKRQQKKLDEALQLFQKFLVSHPDPQRNGGALWEAAWTSYLVRDYQGAAIYLKKLSGNGDLREKALYWQGRALSNLGDAKGAQLAFATLAEEYPFGYYALICNRWCDLAAFPVPPRSLSEALPLPAGFEREKALIGLGLFDEASRELSATRKNKNALGIARLFLEMDNYNGALHAVAKENPQRSAKESAVLWGVSYPLAFRDEVVKNAAATALPESLIYAIMRTESNYLPGALSPVGAVGLMQIMPATAEAMSKGDSVRLTRPELNIRLGARYLKDQMATYNRNIPLTAAAYNAGPANVKRWQKSFAGLPQDEFIESIPFRETREYVKKVVSTMELYQRLYRLPAADKKN
jgi:soluble lytic murein transglycosylase